LEKEPNNTEAMLGLLLNSTNFEENAAMMKGWIAKGVSFPRLQFIFYLLLSFLPFFFCPYHKKSDGILSNECGIICIAK
jgi:hypothetical protein